MCVCALDLVPRMSSHGDLTGVDDCCMWTLSQSMCVCVCVRFVPTRTHTRTHTHTHTHTHMHAFTEDVESWTPKAVAQWLVKCNPAFDKYKAAFVDEQVR